MKMSRRKIYGITIDILIVLSILITNDINYLKFIGILAIILLMWDETMNKL